MFHSWLVALRTYNQLTMYFVNSHNLIYLKRWEKTTLFIFLIYFNFYFQIFHFLMCSTYYFFVQSLNFVWLFMTPWVCSMLGFPVFFFFSTLFYFTILYWFCHTSTWICHGCTWVPNPEPPSYLPPHTISLGHPSAPVPSILYPASNLDWQFISYMILYMFQCHSPKLSHPLPLPQSPKVCSIHLCLFCYLAYRAIVTIFLNSIYMH